MITHEYIRANGHVFHVALAGPTDGPAVLLLHGFPEFWYGWTAQIEALAAAGYRVIAPDQRGYNLSDKPKDIGAYRATELVADVIGLLDALDIATATLIAHDWGGAIAWWVADMHPDRLSALIILNSPHPKSFGKALREDPNQKRRSLYMLFFRWRILPELLLSVGHFVVAWWALQQTARPDTFTRADRRAYKAAWSQPNAMRSMLHWYRAMAAYRPPSIATPIQPPTLIVWGEDDPAFVTWMAQDSADRCADATLHTLPEATHWLHHEYPDRVNEFILEFLAIRTNEGRNVQ